jgi:hypothetical protein
MLQKRQGLRRSAISRSYSSRVTGALPKVMLMRDLAWLGPPTRGKPLIASGTIVERPEGYWFWAQVRSLLPSIPRSFICANYSVKIYMTCDSTARFIASRSMLWTDIRGARVLLYRSMMFAIPSMRRSSPFWRSL